MSIELTLLGATLILAFVQIMLAGQFRTRQYGTSWNMGARDEALPPLQLLPARLLRAQANLFETLPLFIGAVLAAVVAGRLGTKTDRRAPLFLGPARVRAALCRGHTRGPFDRLDGRDARPVARHRRAHAGVEMAGGSG